MKRIILRVFAVIFLLAGSWYAVGSGLVLFSGRTERIVPALAGIVAGFCGVLGSMGLLKRERWGWKVMMVLFSAAAVWAVFKSFVLPFSLGGVFHGDSLSFKLKPILGPLILLALTFWLRDETDVFPKESKKLTTLDI